MKIRGEMIRVTFALPAAEPPGAVSVVGDFNGWDPLAHPLRRRANQTRSVSVTVPTGSTLRFRYLAEGGRWFDDETVSVRDDRDALLTV
ncbi:MAG: isoamylase early set domain-containing protein [Trebonia sp.]